jgi:hypothetical protein
VTVEAVAAILSENPAGLIVARDELAGWLESFGQYKPKGGADLPKWLEMHRAGPLTVDRKGGGTDGGRTSLLIPRGAVSVCGTFQPGVLARLMTKQTRQSGLMARLLVAMPPRKPKQWTDDDVDPATVDAYAELLRRLHQRPATTGPVPLPLSPGAKELWVRFYNSWNTGVTGAAGDLAAAFAKMEGYAARLALIHHVITTVSETAPSPVSDLSMAAGIALAEWFGCEAERVYAVLSESEGDAELVSFIRSKGGRIRLRDIQLWKPHRYPNDGDRIEVTPYAT